MSFSKTSLRNLTARVVVSPPPVSLHESTAVLKRLQCFGPVTSFTRVVPKEMDIIDRDNPKKEEIHVVFTSAEAVQKACDATPFTVELNHDNPDPQVVDPYNVRNLQSRKLPRPSSMTCRAQRQDEDESPLSGRNILSSGFSPSNKTRLYQSLLDVKPPPNLMDGLGVLKTDQSDILSTAQLIEAPPDLTRMYGLPISSHQSKEEHGYLPGGATKQHESAEGSSQRR